MIMFLARLFTRLPFKFFHLLADLLYLLIFKLIGYRKKVVKNNLRNSFPEKSGAEIEQICRGFYRNLCDIIVETIKCLTIQPEEVKKRVTFRNKELVDRLTNEYGGIVAATSHNANWEFMIVAIAAEGIPIEGIYRPLTNRFADKFIYEVRAHLGGYPIPIDKLVREIAKRRKDIKFLMNIADQSPGHSAKKFWTTFLNQETAFLKGTAYFARLLNYPVVFVECERIKRGYYQVNFKELALPPFQKNEEDMVTRKYVDYLEDLIRRQPEDWLWSHKRWKRKRSQEEKIN